MWLGLYRSHYRNRRTRLHQAVGVGVVVMALLGASAQGSATSGSVSARLVARSRDTGRVIWQRSTGSTANLTVVLSTRRLIVAQIRRCGSEDRGYRVGDSKLVSFDAASGRQRWQISDVGPDGQHELPSGGVVLSDYVQQFPTGVIPVFASRDDSLFGLSAGSGRRRWRIAAHGMLPRGGNSSLIVLATIKGTGPLRLRAVARRSGKQVWRATLPHSTAVVGISGNSSTLALIADDSITGVNVLALLDVRTGTARAETVLGNSFSTTLDVVGSTAVVSTAGGVRGFDVHNGAPLWESPGFGHAGRPTSLTETSVVFVQGSDRLAPFRALDGATGSTMWSTTAGFFSVLARKQTAVALAGGGGSYSVFDVATGRLLWSSRWGDEQITVGDAAIYVGGGCATTNLD